MRVQSSIALLFIAGLMSSGCRTCPSPPPAVPQPPQLTTEHRQITPVDVSQLHSDPQPVTQVQSNTVAYYRLTAEECHQLACIHSAPARMIEIAAHDNQKRSFFDMTPPAADEMRARIAAHLSQEARIRTSAGALELYFKLLEAELLSDVLTESQKDLDELIKSGEAMSDRGFRESTEFLQLRKQQVELRADRARLQSGIRRLNVELKHLIGLPGDPTPILPAEQIQVIPQPLEPDQAVQVGMASRPDLQMLRYMTQNLDNRTIDAVRQAIASLVPPLGAFNKTTRVLLPGLRAFFPYLAEGDVVSMRRQLTNNLNDREREANKDIRAAVDEWTSQRELVAIAKRRVEVETNRVRELEVKRKAGVSVELEYRRARLDSLKAQSDLVREAVKWRQADIKARQYMGILCDGLNPSCQAGCR